MINLNHGSGQKIKPRDFSDAVNEVIDAGIMKRRDMEPERNYLGASLLGDPCNRKLGYIYGKVPVDPGKEITAKQARIFATGHEVEDAAVAQFDDDWMETTFKRLASNWLTDAGFKLVTRDAAGKQFGGMTLNGKLGWHIDGAITECPGTVYGLAGVQLPWGWEHKGLATKYWSQVKKHGVKIASQVYYGQMQIYMAYMNLWAFMFSATNKNTSEMHHEIVKFDPRVAQDLSDRGLMIVTETDAGHLLDRCATNSDFFRCKMCSWRTRCWSEE